MKKAFLAVGFSLFAMIGASLPAFASGVAGGIVVGAGTEVVSGSVGGTASALSQGQQQVGSQVIGTGNSMQHSDGTSVANSFIGGTLGFNGAQLNTNTFQSAQVNTNGNVSGNTPMVADNGSIINGSVGFGNAQSLSNGSASFNKVGVGAVSGIGGIAGIQGF